MEQLITEYAKDHSAEEMARWISDMCKRINSEIADDLKDKNFELLCYSLNRMSIVAMMAKALSDKLSPEPKPPVVA